MFREVPETVRRKHHRLVTPQLPESVKEVYAVVINPEDMHSEAEDRTMFRSRIEGRTRLVKEQQANLRVLLDDGPHERPGYSESLHLASAQLCRFVRGDTSGLLQSIVVNLAPCERRLPLRLARVFDAHWRLEVRAEASMQLLHDCICTCELGSEQDAIVVVGASRVAHGDVVPNLMVR